MAVEPIIRVLVVDTAVTGLLEGLRVGNCGHHVFVKSYVCARPVFLGVHCELLVEFPWASCCGGLVRGRVDYH